ncbi:MAG: hypothetical protein AB1465_02805 [Patescibacteria group bacterium]
MRKGKFKRQYNKLTKMLEYLDECLKEKGIDPNTIPIKEKYDAIKVIQQMQGNWVRFVKLYAGWLAAIAGLIYAFLSKAS